MVSHRQSTSRAQKKKLKGAKHVEVLCSLLVVFLLLRFSLFLFTDWQHSISIKRFGCCSLAYARCFPVHVMQSFESISHCVCCLSFIHPRTPSFYDSLSRPLFRFFLPHVHGTRAYPPPLLHPPKNGTAIVNVKSIDYRKIALHVLLCCRTLWKFLYTCHFSQL